LVEKLIEAGSDVNATNSFGFSCLHEACHRGFADIVRQLLKGKVDLTYIPSEVQATNSPFASAPCQSVLAEAARCGFYKIVQVQDTAVVLAE
jgi:ankyrin repeat protein